MSLARHVSFVLAMLVAAPVLAHPGGHGYFGPPASEDAIRAIAPRAVAAIVERGKLGPTWKDATLKAAERKEIEGEKIWLVSFENPKEADKTKTTFFRFFTLSGELVGANFSGK